MNDDRWYMKKRFDSVDMAFAFVVGFFSLMFLLGVLS